MNTRGMVIVGAGEAGARAAVELRTQGWKGPIRLIGDERLLPYERPPLSKQHLTSDEWPNPVTILDERRLQEYDIQRMAGVSAVGIDRPGRAVELSGGIRVPYERLLLATGAEPRRLNVDGTGAGDMLYLRRFADALAIRKRLQPGKRVAIIGGGFIGLETAASAIARGCEVRLIEAGPRILMRGVPERIAALVEERHRRAGVEFKLGAAIDRVEREGETYAIHLGDGTQVRCDLVIAGIGAVPQTSLAAGCGLAIDNGIRVDERLATEDPDVFAAGDCCSFPHPLYDGRRIRLEAWRNAQDQGAHAAANMLGASEPYAAVPWFWSDQYELTLQVAGLSDSADDVVLRDLGEAGKLIFHIGAEGRLVSASAIGDGGAIAKQVRLAEMLIERRAKPSPAALADPGVQLKDLLKARSATGA